MRSYCALALNFLEVFALARQDLEEVASCFPEEAKAIRRHAVHLACRRAFILEAQLRKAAALLRRDLAPALPEAGAALHGEATHKADASAKSGDANVSTPSRSKTRFPLVGLLSAMDIMGGASDARHADTGSPSPREEDTHALFGRSYRYTTTSDESINALRRELNEFRGELRGQLIQVCKETREHAQTSADAISTLREEMREVMHWVIHGATGSLVDKLRA